MNKKILVISPTPTHPPFAGDRKAILSYSEMLKGSGYEVYFLWVANFNRLKEEEELTREYWQDKLYIFKKNQLHRLRESFFRCFRFNITKYYKTDDFYPFGIKKLIKKIQKENEFDGVVINYIYLTKIFKYITKGTKIIFNIDVFSNKFHLTGLRWFSVQPNEEARAVNRADVILSIQEEEATFYRYITMKKVLTTYSYFPITNTPLIGNKTLLYLAGPNKYNVDGITYFIENVYDKIRQAYPEVTLKIGGRICNELKLFYNREAIEFYGDINDPIKFYSLGDIFLNPTFNGNGLKIKTFEAMSFGKVLICNPHSTVGILNRETAPIKTAHDADEYLKHLDILFNHKNEVIRIKEESIKYIECLNNTFKERFMESLKYS